MNISSGPVFGPIQPQNVPDFSALSGKYSASQDMPSFSGGTQSISYGNNSAGGTDFASLSGSGSNNNQIDTLLMQVLAQMLGQSAQGILQMLQLLQQLTGGDQQQAGETTNSNTGGRPTSTPESAVTQSPVTTPINAAESTPEESAISTPTSAVATTAGSSGLHLPDSLKRYESAIMNAAEKTGVPAEVLAGQIWQESRGQETAVTVNGGNGLADSGVMQVNQNTFADLQSKNPQLLGPNASPSNASDSIMAGALYMKEQMNAFGGDIGAALRAYNSGPGNVNVNDLTDISKTGTGDATYVEKVLNFANIISSGNGTLPA